MDMTEAEIVDGGEGSGGAPSESSAGRLAALLYPPQDAIARRNRIAWVVLFAMVPLAGSVLSVSVALLAIWAAISLVLGRFQFRLTAADRPVVLSSLLFVLILAVTDFLHQPPLGAALNALSMLFFVAPAVLVSRMRAGEGGPVLPAVYRGAAIGGCVLLPIVLTQYFLLGMQRVAGFEGNPGPLSVVALLTSGLALLDLSSKNPAGRNVLALVGALGAIVALFLTGMRGSLPALPLVILIAIVARRHMLFGYWRDGGVRRRALAVASGALAVAAVGFVVAPPLLARLAETEANLGLLSTQPYAMTSIALRVDLYAAAWQAFLERPLFGWGASGLWKAVQPHLDPTLYNGFSFNHLHNIFLTVGVEAGLLGIAALIATIAAPLWTAWRWRALPAGHDRLAFAAILTSAFLIPGMTNIMFFHDILDSVWALSVATLCASVPMPDMREAGVAARPGGGGDERGGAEGGGQAAARRPAACRSRLRPDGSDPQAQGGHDDRPRHRLGRYRRAEALGGDAAGEAGLAAPARRRADQFEPATLVLACEAPAALRVQHQSSELIARVNAFFGYPAVARIKLVQKPVTTRRPDKRPPLRKLTEDDHRNVEAMVARIEDPGLRTALVAFAEASLQRSRS